MALPKIHYLPLYDIFFSQGYAGNSWESFESTADDINTPLSKRPVDFSLRTETREWKDIANDLAYLFLRVIIFPWGIYDLGRFIVQRIVMMPLYPLQSRIITFILNLKLGCFSKSNLQSKRCTTLNKLKKGIDGGEKFIVRDVVFEKNGVLYNGFLIGKTSSINNGNWAVQATGNLESIEHSAKEFAKIYATINYNILLINGPSIGKNEAHSTPDSMGEVQELGITYLETAIKAEKIVIAGRSLGGAALNQAILKHQLDPNIKYLVVRQMTFDRASHIASVVVGEFLPKLLSDLVERIVIWSGCEMDCIEASRKLQELNIKEVIVQATKRPINEGDLPKMEDFQSDGAIPAEASLGYGLIKENIVENKVFICVTNIRHAENYTIMATRNEIENFYPT